MIPKTNIKKEEAHLFLLTVGRKNSQQNMQTKKKEKNTRKANRVNSGMWNFTNKMLKVLFQVKLKKINCDY
jgi:hypothetical protein